MCTCLLFTTYSKKYTMRNKFASTPFEVDADFRATGDLHSIRSPPPAWPKGDFTQLIPPTLCCCFHRYEGRCLPLQQWLDMATRRRKEQQLVLDDMMMVQFNTGRCSFSTDINHEQFEMDGHKYMPWTTFGPMSWMGHIHCPGSCCMWPLDTSFISHIDITWCFRPQFQRTVS